MCDKLVFDLAQEVEGSPNVFVRKDWVNILDNQNQNYSNNQSIIDTSQLSNSNKYMSYRESYLAMPLLMTMALPPNGITIFPDATSTTTATTAANQTLGRWGTAGGAGSADYSIGLKNWFGNIIHSFTMDYNGTTIFQQTPLINMWNSFKLMTSLSYQDVLSQGAVIGFFPDDASTFQFFPTSDAGSATTVVPVVGTDGLMQGVTNNTNYMGVDVVNARFNSFSSGLGNAGFLQRQQLINFDSDAFITSAALAGTVPDGNVTATYGSLLAGTTTTLTNLWKSYIITKQSASISIAAGAAGVAGVVTYTTLPMFQIAVMAIIKLKHIHSFFNMCPLLKGVFMKLTLNLNNTTTNLVSTFSTLAAGAVAFNSLHTTAVSNAVGGINPLMVASPAPNNGGNCFDDGLFTFAVAGGSVRVKYDINVSVGARCLDPTLKSITGYKEGPLAQSVYLYVPAYTFNPPFEQAILSSPIKQINYTDVYQYQITNIGTGQMINQLITNGIANIKSVLILPFFNPTAGTNYTNLKSGANNNSNSGFLGGIPVFQSPYDPAGTGPTSPLSHITNFNVQISGQNAIYNLQKYNFEQFNNQLYGQNAVNGGLTDGLTSGLVGRQEFDMNYCYYYVNVERMLPVEMGVPKSVQIIGENRSSKAMDYYVFVEYGVKISIDILTGARV